MRRKIDARHTTSKLSGGNWATIISTKSGSFGTTLIGIFTTSTLNREIFKGFNKTKNLVRFLTDDIKLIPWANS